MIMKPTIFGSKFTSFDAGSKRCEELLSIKRTPTIEKYVDGRWRQVEICIIQIAVTPYGDKLRYTIEYMEK